MQSIARNTAMDIAMRTQLALPVHAPPPWHTGSGPITDIITEP